jgi:hypothetical protein
MTTKLLSPQMLKSPEIIGEQLQAAPRESHSVPELKLEILTGKYQEVCLADWVELERRLENQRLTCSSAWIKNWLEVYGDLVNYEFAIAKVEQRVCGVALIVHSQHLKNGYFKIRSTHLGTAGEPHGHSVVVEYNSLLVEDHYRQQFCKQLYQLVFTRSDWDELHLDGYEDQELEPFALSHMPDNKIQYEYQQRESRYLNLANLCNQRQDILSALGKSTKSNIKRKLKVYGEIKLEWAENQQAAILIFDELIALHQARWQQQGLPGAFASERFRQFQLNLIHKLLPEQKVVLFKASAQQETIGCLMLLVDQGRLLDYLSGFAPFASGTSPGLMTHYLCMEEALKRGFLAYDFLVGDKRHKENLGKESTTITWFKAQRKTWKFRMQEFLRLIKHKFLGMSKCVNPEITNPAVHTNADHESTSSNS